MDQFTILLIFISAQIAINLSEIINANEMDQFAMGTIRCNGTENCTVICDGQSSCWGADIYCPDEHACEIQCGSYYGNRTSYPQSCYGATFHCPSNAQCNISCVSFQYAWSGEEACRESIFHWPTTAPYDSTYSLTCNGAYACQMITINIPMNEENEAIFVCEGEDGCDGSIINCPPNSDCFVWCEGEDSCANAQINCEQTSSCIVDCEGEDFHGDYTNGCSATNVSWSVNGDNQCLWCHAEDINLPINTTTDHPGDPHQSRAHSVSIGMAGASIFMFGVQLFYSLF